MRHPADGTLRRLLDEPAGVGVADREHVTGCPVCLGALAAAQRDAEAAAAALEAGVTATAPGAGAADVERGWQRLSRAVTAGAVPGAAAGDPPAAAADRGRPRGRPWWRPALRSPVVAGVAAVALLAGAGAAAAADWLPIFRTERIAPLVLDRAELVALPDLSAYGDVRPAGEPDVRTVADAATARQVTGLDVPQVRALPRGVTGEPAYRVGDRAGLTFTFRAATAARTAAAAGRALPPPPPGLDGSSFRLTAGPGVAAVWASTAGVPALVVARAVAPAAYSTGVPFPTARDYLLSLPGVPADVAARLRTFSGDGTTLPLPVAGDELTSAAADVGGIPATVLASRDGVLAGVVWVDGGVVTAVAGSLSRDEVLAVARGLDRP